MTIAVSGNKHDGFFGAALSFVFDPFLKLRRPSDEGFIDLNYSA